MTNHNSVIQKIANAMWELVPRKIKPMPEGLKEWGDNFMKDKIAHPDVFADLWFGWVGEHPKQAVAWYEENVGPLTKEEKSSF